MRTHLLAGCLASSLVLASAIIACGSESASGDSGPVARSSLERDTSPVVPAADAESLRKGNTAFALDLYETLGSEPDAKGKNLFFAPYSITTAIAMAYAGARGNTEKELATAMHFDLSQGQLHPAINALDLALESRGKNQKGADGTPFRLHTTNSVWGAPDLSFAAPFLDTLARNYGAGVRLTDFGKDPEGARVTINDWTKNETENRIDELLPKDSLTTDTRLVLVNAAYFNAAWSSPFWETGTRKATFHGSNGDAQVDMMTWYGSIPYAETETYEAIALPYGGNELSFVAVLPNEIGAFDATLSAEKVSQIVASLGSSAVKLHFPKFKIEGKSFSLKKALQARGVNDAFELTANFSGITAESILISDVFHQAFVSVDEKGTEAAAATAVVSADSGAPGAPRDAKEVTFDKPFVFFVRDNATGAILFLGRLQSP